MWKSADGWLVGRSGGWVALNNSTLLLLSVAIEAAICSGKMVLRKCADVARETICIWFELDFYWSELHYTFTCTLLMEEHVCDVFCTMKTDGMQNNCFVWSFKHSFWEVCRSRFGAASALCINPRCTSPIDGLRAVQSLKSNPSVQLDFLILLLLLPLRWCLEHARELYATLLQFTENFVLKVQKDIQQCP